MPCGFFCKTPALRDIILGELHCNFLGDPTSSTFFVRSAPAVAFFLQVSLIHFASCVYLPVFHQNFAAFVKYKPGSSSLNVRTASVLLYESFLSPQFPRLCWQILHCMGIQTLKFSLQKLPSRWPFSGVLNSQNVMYNQHEGCVASVFDATRPCVVSLVSASAFSYASLLTS